MRGEEVEGMCGHSDEPIMLVATEYNWGLHRSNDWSSVTWTVRYDGSYDVRTYYGDETLPHRESHGELDKAPVNELRSILDTKPWRKNPPADACDGNAWEMKYFSPEGKKLNYSGKAGYIYGEKTLERIADLMPKEGVYEEWEG